MTTKFLLGVPEVDRQHAIWIDLAERFRAAVEGHLGNPKGVDAAISALEELLSYTKTHFASEEKIMAASHYRDLAVHAGMHRTITDALEKLLTEAKADRSSTPLKLHLFLTIWLMEHIATEDKKYVQHIGASVAA